MVCVEDGFASILVVGGRLSLLSVCEVFGAYFFLLFILLLSVVL